VSVKLPPGVRDHLPQAAARRRGVVAALQREFERWGYRALITPLYEYDEVLRLGLGVPHAALRLVEPGSGEVLAIRPDLTAQVARVVATRLHDEPGPVRLHYEGSVVRAGAELYQAGVELIDAPQPAGDLEILLVADAALEAAGITGRALDLGHADVARAALAGLDLDPKTDQGRAEELHTALLRKDESAVARLARALELPAQQKKLLTALPSLYGGPEVIARARSLVGDKKRSQEARALDELEQLVERLGTLGLASRLTIDLGEVRGFDYYTGSRFSIYADGAGGALASGGRYDRLIERYGRPARATGFAVDVDRVSELLKARGADAPSASGGLYLAGDPLLAARLAGRLHASGVRAILDLDGEEAETVLSERAARFRLDRVVILSRDRLRWFDVGNKKKSGSLSGPTLKKLWSGDQPLDGLLPKE
jgi:ATP phosphoribosyltransferase regulatory subunit